MFSHTERLGNSPPRLKLVLSDSAHARHYLVRPHHLTAQVMILVVRTLFQNGGEPIWPSQEVQETSYLGR